MKHTALRGFAIGLCIAMASGLVADDADWMTDERGVLDLKLALAEQGGICGTTLLVDRIKRLVLFAGAPGPRGCTWKLEARFEEVASVKTGDGAGFLLKLKKGKANTLLLIPVPHFQWLLDQPMVVTSGNLAQSMSAAGLRGPGGEEMRPSGAAAGAGPQLKKVELPRQVAVDTETAVRAIREALGKH
jgi:hypothetical protein